MLRHWVHILFHDSFACFFVFGYGELGRGWVSNAGIYDSTNLTERTTTCSTSHSAQYATIYSPSDLSKVWYFIAIGSHHLEYGFPSTVANTFDKQCFHRPFFPQSFIPSRTHLVTPRFYGRILDAPKCDDGWSCKRFLIAHPFSYLVQQIVFLPDHIHFLYCFSLSLHKDALFYRVLDGRPSWHGYWWVRTDWTGIPVLVSSLNALSSFLDSERRCKGTPLTAPTHPHIRTSHGHPQDTRSALSWVTASTTLLCHPPPAQLPEAASAVLLAEHTAEALPPASDFPCLFIFYFMTWSHHTICHHISHRTTFILFIISLSD